MKRCKDGSPLPEGDSNYRAIAAQALEESRGQSSKRGGLWDETGLEENASDTVKWERSLMAQLFFHDEPSGPQWQKLTLKSAGMRANGGRGMGRDMHRNRLENLQDLAFEI